jgi:putative ABC transport system permease protein
MFKFLPLLWSNLRRRRLRLFFTLASIVVAFLLFGLLEALRMAFTGNIDLAGKDRLITQNKLTIIQPMPVNYVARIEAVEGVRQAVGHIWFGGFYQDERNQIVSIVTHTDDFFDVYPEIVVSDEAKRAWPADRTGALVGRALATRFGWKVGDRIPLRSAFYFQNNGSSTWDLNVSAIFDVPNGDTNALYFQYDYLNEGRRDGAVGVNWIAMRVDDPAQSPAIARKIDTMFANSNAETKTSTEQAFAQGFANQMGNIAAIVAAVATAVFFTMLLVTANTMAQSVRERTSELAVMKTMGFSSARVTSLVLAEALLITILGGALGLLLASVVAKGASAALEQFLPFFDVPPQTYLVGAGVMLALGLLSGALPAVQAFRLKIVDALRKA